MNNHNQLYTFQLVCMHSLLSIHNHYNDNNFASSLKTSSMTNCSVTKWLLIMMTGYECVISYKSLHGTGVGVHATKWLAQT
jgi:hypothetical protein